MKIDILFTGHLCLDEVQPYGEEKYFAPGSAVLCGAKVAARTDKKIGVYTRISRENEELLNDLRSDGVMVFPDYSDQTTMAGVLHPSPNVDERRLFIYKDAGAMRMDFFPEAVINHVHLAGISDREFSMDFMKEVRKRCKTLSVDMQSFVRQVDLNTREINFSDVENKKEIVSLMDSVKLDVVEAKILTGFDDLEKAAVLFEEWGARETLITHSDGVLARVNGKTYYEKFSNKSVIGRTGRGDTTFAAYLSARIDHDVDYSLKFASALVSIKMEKKGPFSGTMEEVLERMNAEN